MIILGLVIAWVVGIFCVALGGLWLHFHMKMRQIRPILEADIKARIERIKQYYINGAPITKESERMVAMLETDLRNSRWNHLYALAILFVGIAITTMLVIRLF